RSERHRAREGSPSRLPSCADCRFAINSDSHLSSFSSFFSSFFLLSCAPNLKSHYIKFTYYRLSLGCCHTARCEICCSREKGFFRSGKPRALTRLRIWCLCFP